VPWWNKCFNVSDDYFEVWCVPSATHVPCIHQSQNKVLSTLVCYFILSITKTSLSLYNATNSSSNLWCFDYPEDGGSKLIQNVSNKLPKNTASYTIQQLSTFFSLESVQSNHLTASIFKSAYKIKVILYISKYAIISFCIKTIHMQHNKDSVGSYLKPCNIFLTVIIMCSHRLLETQ
jgi:hypothetical protein